ncbi:MAG: cysteine hydrolase [Nocardioidaceae bacterium]|nr:cysteine hydrolase [Nocardioidaceae bacterium]
MSDLIVGQPVFISIDNQLAGYNEDYAVPQMDGFARRVDGCVAMLTAAREAGIPVIFLQERHSRTLADFGRELDGQEAVHCVEDDPDTELVPTLTPLPDEYHVIKRRYSAFFGTDLEILLKGLNAKTLVLCGALTDVCVHYTFVDAHQHDYHVRVATDAVGGSSQAAHDASLNAMEYLQTGALRSSVEIIAAFRAYDGPQRPPVGGPVQSVMV